MLRIYKGREQSLAHPARRGERGQRRAARRKCGGLWMHSEAPAGNYSIILYYIILYYIILYYIIYIIYIILYFILLNNNDYCFYYTCLFYSFIYLLYIIFSLFIYLFLFYYYIVFQSCTLLQSSFPSHFTIFPFGVSMLLLLAIIITFAKIILFYVDSLSLKMSSPIHVEFHNPLPVTVEILYKTSFWGNVILFLCNSLLLSIKKTIIKITK